MRDATPQTVFLKDYTPPEYLIDSVELSFDLDEQRTLVTSRLHMRRNPQSANQAVTLTLAGEELELVSIAIDGKPLAAGDFAISPESMLIHRVPQEQGFVLDIQNYINPKANTALEGLYLSGSMLCTQCEAQGFRKITWFLDRPDVMSRFKTTLRADKTDYPVLLSNGNKIASGELADGRHWVSWEDPFAKPCYLFALVAGQLECVADSFTTMSGRQIALEIFVEGHNVDKCSHAMQSLKNAMRWDEETYGLEYDLDLYMIVAVDHFNMGAMENKGLNVFNTKFVLARPDTATDSDYEHIEGVIGHEYFHNWSGNRVTCRDWFQLSLKEGFTVFRDQQFTGDRTSAAVKRIEDVNALRTRQFAEDAGPLAHPIRPEAYIEINNFYTLTVYEKGAEVVRMLHTLLGAKGFRKGCDLYFARHDGQAVTCEDFINAMEAANGVELTQFRRWYSQAGTPVVGVDQHFDAKTQQLRLILRQSCPATPNQPEKAPLHVPVKLGLLAPDGSPASIVFDGKTATEITLDLTESEQTFVFDKLAEAPVVSLLRGFSAPVNLDMPRSLEELAFLLRHDSDTFNRWEAGQQLAAKVIFALIEDLQNQRPLHLNALMAKAFHDLLAEEGDDLSYQALLLTLPDESYLAGQMRVIDVEAIHHAREFVKTTLAHDLRDDFERVYRIHHRDESGKFGADAIGRRRLKNACLSYLNQLESASSYALAKAQFEQARNMTDQVAALSAVVNSHHPDKADCLQNFYQQWQHEALVIDKWFALQASSHMPNTFATVQELMRHPAFDMHTPNRVRALIGAFSQANPLHFHAINGEGYRFLADQVLALNTLNPQIASRMVTGLAQWRRYDGKRQELMKQQLHRIVATEPLSKDVYEIASKSLA
ncbi:aminopeptidase N [Methylomonas sp. SURF-2]|uniref:Aminopeptidase N n=1 Tax=Methylomonas subterranea TaxID=2952225 RepID=A0ABT1TKZ4_9GAMM|nr:aminopeptidase N [Methylomonas sp. SURF-2]MCQ8105424.1 aminopeptidase N [Methylomonas sp. SURF-2]